MGRVLMTVGGAVLGEIRARLDVARTPIERAVWSLLLGEHDVRPAGDSGPIGAMAALVAGDREHARRLATDALLEVESYVGERRDLLVTLLSLIAGDERRAESTPLGHGLLRGDAPTVAAEVDAMLAAHVRRARAANSELSNSWRAVVCLDAMAVVVLAHERGVAVPVAPVYRSVNLRLRAIHLTEWEGEPLPRRAPLDVATDLVAGVWLRRIGVPIDDPPPGSAAKPARARRATSRRADAEPALVVDDLRRRLADGRGSPWQLASWALMIGDVPVARERLRVAAAEARAGWRRVRDPNHNVVREHFAYALAVADDDGIREAGAVLVAADVVPRYAHANGALDLIAELLVGARRPTREDAERVTGPLDSTRVACVGLVERDAGLLTQGLEGMLAEHARALERKTSPPPPVCEWAVYVASAARRLALPVDVDAAWASHPVPIELREVPDRRGAVGRIGCDLLARSLVP